MPPSILDPLTKIRSEPLRDQARAESVELQVVLVELDLPCPQLGTERGGPGQALRLRFLGSAPSAGELEARIAEARRELAGILGQQPERYIDAASAFVVQARGDQLRRIACLPIVGAIWPNDRVRPPL